MKTAVIGLGAVGTVIGGLLTKAGENVVLIGKKPQIEELKKKGIKIEGFTKNPIIIKNIKSSSDFSSLSDKDIIFICVKSQDTKNLVLNVKDYLNNSVIVVSLQNGVRNAQNINWIIKKRTISGVIIFNSIYLKPGEVNLTYKAGIVLEAKEKIDFEIAKILNNAGLKVKTVEKIQGYQYSKLIVNLPIAVTALTDQTIIESIINKTTRKIVVSTMREGVEIIEKSGVPLESLPNIDPIKMIHRLEKLNTFILRIGSRFMGVKQDARNSLWQSLSRGKPTEIDYINGEIVDIAKNNNLSAPINSKLVELIKKQEMKKEIKTYLPEELKEILKI